MSEQYEPVSKGELARKKFSVEQEIRGFRNFLSDIEKLKELAEQEIAERQKIVEKIDDQLYRSEEPGSPLPEDRGE